MSDELTQLTTDYLLTIQTQTAAANAMVDGAAMIVQGGVEGIQTIASSDPELIIAALAGMATVIKNMQQQITEMALENVESTEKIHVIAERLQNLTE